MKKSKKEDGSVELPVVGLLSGSIAQANNGEFYKVISVDPVLDPRGGVYEGNAAEALVRFEKGEKCEDEIISGMVRVRAA